MTRSIEKRGEEGARREIDLTAVVCTAADKRLTANIVSFDDNDDELRKSIAQIHTIRTEREFAAAVEAGQLPRRRKLPKSKR